jgi:hypothetical protein
MKPVILVATITRDNENNWDKFVNQLQTSIIPLKNEFNFLLSLYENDSVDRTKQLMEDTDWSFFDEVVLMNENLGLPKYTGGTDAERVQNLALARNKCLEANGLFKKADWVLVVDSDVEYTTDIFEQIVRHRGIDCDIFTGICLTKDTRVIYDHWVTRYVETDRHAPNYELQTGLKEMWATCSGLVLMRAEGFHKGARFSHINPHDGDRDSEMAVICLEFRKRGYGRIWADHSINPTHYQPNLIMFAIYAGPGAEKLGKHIRERVWHTHDVVIVDGHFAPTREYVFELQADELPSTVLISNLAANDSTILKSKPGLVLVDRLTVNMAANNTLETVRRIQRRDRQGEIMQLTGEINYMIYKVNF